MDAAPLNWHCSRFKEQESILGFRRRIRSENFSGSSSFSSRSLRAKRRRKPACTASFPSYDGASCHHLAISSFKETGHRLSYSCRTGRAQGSLGYPTFSSETRSHHDHAIEEPGSLIEVITFTAYRASYSGHGAMLAAWRKRRVQGRFSCLGHNPYWPAGLY